MAAADELCWLEARTLAAMIAARRVSAREVMAAHLDRIRRHNQALTAIVARLDDDADLALSDDADRRLGSGAAVGPLHGLPIAFKDLEPARGFPWTRGSPIYRNFFPAEDSVLVERLRAAGAIPIGKTNVPEFGMGSQSYNRVYGTTRNPYDPTRTAGGSSGGAGTALAAGLLPIADGSDLGGSLRNPASFNNVVALRPTVGLVPVAPSLTPFLGFSVKGPMARTVADVAWLLAAMAGPDPRDPACYPSDPGEFLAPLDSDPRGLRIAWCPDLGGLPLEPAVRAVLDARRSDFESIGCVVEDADPGLAAADEIFLTLRAWRAWINLGPLLERRADELKPEARAEIEAGSRLSGAEIGRALIRHAEFLERIRRFFERYDFLVGTVSQVAPFAAGVTWPREIDGRVMGHYVQWMQSCYWISTTFAPALAVPAGFTADGLPVGLQIVGPSRRDLAVLRLGAGFESATGFGRRRPSLP
jgi:amidase